MQTNPNAPETRPMTVDERLRLPCGICGKPRNQHVGSVRACFGGYGTYWHPDGPRDERVWPKTTEEHNAKR